MDAEDKQKLDRLLELAEDNNAYIKKVRSSQKTAQMFKAIYWVVIIIVMLGGFYFIQPYVADMVNLYNGGIGAIKTVQNFQAPAIPKK